MAGGSKNSAGMLKSKPVSSSTRCLHYFTGNLRRCIIAPKIALLALFILFPATGLLLLLDYKVESISRMATISGYNLNPTPWHLFPPRVYSGTKYSLASSIIKCSYLTSCAPPPHVTYHNHSSSSCPTFFQWIHEDLAPWRRSRISVPTLVEAQRSAAFRIVIVGGRLYVDLYYACVQSRAMFTIWSFLQLLKRYPGLVPDVDLMFDCMDQPVVKRPDYKSPRWPPPPLFRYCSTKNHFDIPFPDWSFWGWPEINIEPWEKEFDSIKQGSGALNWKNKIGHAYWKGNPDVGSPIRTELMTCNNSTFWGAEIVRQDWIKESGSGFQQSKLSNQCKHRYKIYAEGYAWSVSLKYILSCGSLPLIISPQFYDFFSRGLVPKESYWPVRATKLCRSIKFAVDWGNDHPFEAEAIGKGAQDFMQENNMETIYDYMFHLVTEYSKLQNFQPIPLEWTKQICEETLLCFADPIQRRFLEASRLSAASSSPPCEMPLPDHELVKRWKDRNIQTISDIRKMEEAWPNVGNQQSA